MPVVCLWIPAFRLAVARRGPAPLAPDAPAIVADKRERGRVVDRSPAAAALGVQPGMTLVQATAIAPEAEVAIDDPAAVAALWDRVLDALDACSPIVEDAALGTALLEMHGIDGGPAAWLAAVTAALAGFGLPLRRGVGPNPFLARAAATLRDATVVDGAPAAFLAPLPLATLDLPGDVAARLGLLGIETLGALAALPHGPFVRRFGAAAAVWHDRARGIDPRPLRPRPRAVRVERVLQGEGEAHYEEQVLFALRTLVGWVVDDLVAAGRRAGRLALTLQCDDGAERTVTTRVAAPTAVPATLFELLRARLEGVALDSPVIGLRLAADDLERGGAVLSLFAQHDPDPDALGIAVARLDAALGDGAARRAHLVEAARWERRYRLEPFTFAAPALAPPPPALPANATLQLRVLAPAAVDVVARGGAPCFVGTPPQAVVEHAGPWRVDEGWWSAATGDGAHVARDEYDVLLDDGSLLRIASTSSGWSLVGTYD